MSFDYRLFSLTGRISRKSYWWGLVLLTLLTFVLIVALMKFVGISKAQLLGNEVRSQKVWHLYFLVVLTIPTYNLMVKRLHDLNKSAWWLVPILGVNFIFNMMQYLDLSGSRHDPTIAFLIVTILAFYANLWLLYTLGFKRGTSGGNDYGPAPLI